MATALLDRPDDWEWTSTIESGAAIEISALEWNLFCDRINEFRVYQELKEYSFTTVVSGQVISAAVVNQAISAISAISGHGTLPSQAVSGVTKITARFFHQLKDALNAIK